MTIQKTGATPKLRLREAVKKLVAEQSGGSELQRVEKLAEKLDWSTTLIYQVMGRQATDPAWLPQGAKLARLFERTGVSADWVFTAKGEMIPTAKHLEAHVSTQLAGDRSWQRLKDRYDTGIDGEKALAFLVATVRELVTELEEVESVLDDAQSSLGVALEAPNAPRARLTHATRKVMSYLAHSRPDVQERAGELLRDWTPNAFGFGISDTTIIIDRHGAKRRR